MTAKHDGSDVARDDFIAIGPWIRCVASSVRSNFKTSMVAISTLVRQ